MSRCCSRQTITPMVIPQQSNNCICSLPTLVILILIVLQFSRFKDGYCDGEDGKDYPIGNGILFIIALFFLSCSGCGKGGAVGYGAY